MQIGEDHWIYRIASPFAQVEYKILINDVTWEDGSSHHILPEENATEAPYFNVSAARPIPGYLSPGKWTALSIRYNAGWGNSLSIVGNGPKMSWHTPSPLTPVGEDLWVAMVQVPGDGEFEYKLVLNGKQESGPNHRAKAGSKEEVYPRF